MATDTLASHSPLQRGESSAGPAVYEQGIAAGVLGAAAIALWFFFIDLVQGRPLFTPSVLGTFLFHGGAAVAAPERVPISFQMVVVFTWIHFLVFIVIGIAASLLLDVAERNRNLGFGIVMFFVFFEFGFAAFSTFFAESVLTALTLTKVLLGNLLAAAVMGVYFWRHHQRMVIEP